jgi:hypothetical protein
VPRSTEYPPVPRSESLKQRTLLVAIAVLGLGALGATVGLRAGQAVPLEAVPLRAADVSAAPAHTQQHRAANADLDVGPGEAEPTLASCPQEVR